MKIKAFALVLVTLSSSGCVAFLPLMDRQSDMDVSPENENVKSSSIFDSQVNSGATEGSRYQNQRLSKQQKIAQLIDLLEHERDVVRTNAATDLGSYGPLASVAVDRLAEAVRSDESEWVRRAAVKSLGKIGTAEVYEPLKEAQNDQNRWVAHSATNVLRQLGNSNFASSNLNTSHFKGREYSEQAAVKSNTVNLRSSFTLRGSERVGEKIVSQEARESIVNTNAGAIPSGVPAVQNQASPKNSKDSPVRYQARGSEIKKL